MLFIPNVWANDWITIESSEYTMGCASSENSQCDQDELPAHRVRLSAYAIQRTEVTQTEWEACVNAGACVPTPYHWDPSTFGNWPVTGMSRPEAEAYCGWIGGRLPTEAEWELAARGTDGRINPWGNESPSCERARLRGCGPMLGPVGEFPKGASPYGLQDMIGNAWEYVSDYYRNDFYAESPAENPKGPSSANMIAIRSPNSFDILLPSATQRITAPIMVRASVLGFRCAHGQE